MNFWHFTRGESRVDAGNQRGRKIGKFYHACVIGVCISGYFERSIPPYNLGYFKFQPALYSRSLSPYALTQKRTHAHIERPGRFAGSARSQK